MLTPTFLRHAGSNSFNGGSIATVAVPLMSDVLPYQLCLIALESAALGAINGETDEHTLTDAAGTVYTKIGEQTRQPEPFRPGCTLSLWMVRPLVNIPVGTLVTGTFSAAGQRWGPSRNGEYPRMLEVTLTLRNVSTAPWLPYFT